MSDAYKVAYNTWQEKTEWVQTDKRFEILFPWGKHRADVLKEYIERLESQVIDMAVQLANAKSKCRELAAENAKLAECANFYRLGFKPVKGAFGIEYRPTEQLLDDCGNTAIEAIKTPATDAFLAEVLASELDSLAGVAETMLVKFSNQRCSQDMHEVVGWKMVLQQASNRAAKLRKGAVL